MTVASLRAKGVSSLDHLERCFRAEGRLCFEGVVEPAALATLSDEIIVQYRSDLASGRLFSGGGNLSGHLNCFPGAGSRFVYEALEAAGIIDVVRALSAGPLEKPNIGCNLNLPGSRAQNEHIDGYAAEPFLIVNVAAVDTDISNGAMQILCGTHQKTHKYWDLLLTRPERRRVLMKQGDVLIRTSTLWHRGMPNMSPSPRPMLAFTWENGGTHQGDPYAVHAGRITFLPNRYSIDWKGSLRERAFVAAPRLGTVYHAVRSLFD